METDKNISQQNQQNNSQRKYKNVIFDLGGVLMYWYPQEMFKKLFNNDEAKEEELIKATKTKVWKDFDRGHYMIDGLLEKLVEQGFNKENVNFFLQNLTNLLQPMEKGKKLYDIAKSYNCKIYILTNLSKDLYQFHFEQNYPFFRENDGVISSCNVGYVKPEKEIFQIVLDTWKIKPEETLFVDDKKENVSVASQFGIDGIVCKDHQVVEQELKQKLEIRIN